MLRTRPQIDLLYKGVDIAGCFPDLLGAAFTSGNWLLAANLATWSEKEVQEMKRRLEIVGNHHRDLLLRAITVFQLPGKISDLPFSARLA